MQVRFCNTCVFPETKPDLHIGDDGRCSACAAAARKAKEIDWEARKRQFFEVVAQYKSKNKRLGYDCVVPVSGGKDSTYQTWFILNEAKLKPLCVCFETTAVTELGQRNLDNLSKLGVDVIHFKKDYQTYRKMVIEGFRRVGDEMWPNHIGIFTVPVNIAVNFKIPLIIWGENPQMEYGAPSGWEETPTLNRGWLEEYGGLLGNRIQDMIGVDGITERDLTPYVYPSDRELADAGVRGLFLGYYFFWDARKQVEIVKKHGFAVKEDGPVEGTYTNYENLDEKMHGLHDYLKFVKYGFGRATDHACIDIRNGRMSREEGLALVRQYDGKYPHYGVKNFIEYSGLSKDEIDRVIESFTNALLFKRTKAGTFVRDGDGNLVRDYEVGWTGG